MKGKNGEENDTSRYLPDWRWLVHELVHARSRREVALIFPNSRILNRAEEETLIII